MTYESWRISYQSSEQAARAAYAECARLQAKVEAMERQEPVGKFIQHPSNGIWEQDGYGDNPDARPLYLAPAQKEKRNETQRENYTSAA